MTTASPISKEVRGLQKAQAKRHSYRICWVLEPVNVEGNESAKATAKNITKDVNETDPTSAFLHRDMTHCSKAGLAGKMVITRP